MKLPVGVYAVSQSFEGAEGSVEFVFCGITYQAQVGVNAFAYLEHLSNISLQAPEVPFCGYSDVPVVILPAGVYKIGTIKESRFRTYLPCAMAILGENAGITPNGLDLCTPAFRNEESVVHGSFYFGCIALKNGVEGTLTLDGLTLESVKVFDERSEGDFCGLTLRNCRFADSLCYNLVYARALESGQRVTRLEDCRADGIGSYFGEGRLLDVGSGQVTVERLYFANTDKFPGLTNYSRTAVSQLDSFLLKDSIFAHCGSVHGLSILPGGAADIRLEGCQFIDFAPAEDAALWLQLEGESRLTVNGCRFEGDHSAPAIEIEGNTDAVTISNTCQTGYRTLVGSKPPRRTAVQPCCAPVADPHESIPGDFAPLEQLYAGRKLSYCDFHCHSNSGGTSDGKTPLGNYVEDMKKLGVDCAAIVDHKQMRHYFLPEWDEQYMICGSEPSTRLEGRDSSMDYTMLFPDKTGLAQVMGAFPEFKFTGTWDGHFIYPRFTVDRFRELGEYIYSIGGLLSHAHPMQLPGSGQPEDYFFSEQIAFETVHGDVNAFATRQNHRIWAGLLQLGKRVRTHGSSDSHGPVSNRGLTTVYTEKHFSTDIFNRIRSGDCTAGGVGIRMCIGTCPMGGVAEFSEGQQLTLRVEDFHSAHWKPETVYSLKVYTDKGLAYALEFDGRTPVSLALAVQKRSFYRCEVWNESDSLPVAFSNPIWLD